MVRLEICIGVCFKHAFALWQAQNLARLRRCFLQTLGAMQRRRQEAFASLAVRDHRVWGSSFRVVLGASSLRAPHWRLCICKGCCQDRTCHLTRLPALSKQWNICDSAEQSIAPLTQQWAWTRSQSDVNQCRRWAWWQRAMARRPGASIDLIIPL